MKLLRAVLQKLTRSASSAPEARAADGEGVLPTYSRNGINTGTHEVRQEMEPTSHAMANNATANELANETIKLGQGRPRPEHTMTVPDHDWQGRTVEYSLDIQHNYQYRGNRETENAY